MAGESKEITMFPYQLSKVLADERIHDLVAASERRGQTAAARHQGRDLTGSAPRFRAVAAQFGRLLARSDGRREARSRSTVTSVSGPGPMGCSA